MSEATNIFMNSYLKKMRRPELSGGYSPDEAFGANLAHGSESINPNALRDKTNAQYGGMKSSLQQGPAALMQNVMGGGNTTNSTPSPMMQTAGLVAPKFLSDWATEKLRSYLNKPTEAFAETMRQTPTDPMSLFEAPKYDVAEGMGGYQKVGENFASGVPKPSSYVAPEVEGGSILEGINPSSVASSAALMAAPMLTRTLTGSRTAGDAVGAAGSVGLAAAQGGMNPLSDLAAVYSLYNLIKGIF